MAFSGRVAGLKIELEIDGSKVSKGLEAQSKAVNKVKSNLKDLEKSLKLNPTNADLLRQKFELLKRSINENEKYLKGLKQGLQELAGIKDPTQKQIDQMNNLEREISDTQQVLKNLKKEYVDFGSVAQQQIKAVGQKMQEFGSSISSMGSKLTSTGMAIERLTAPIQAAFAYGLKETMSFEQSMANVRAVTGATSEQFAELEKAAIDFSKTTVYSADETAQALYYMGLAGWDSKDAIAALPGVLDLAAAGQVDLGNAASIVVDAMTAMGVEVTETTNGLANASHFTNVLAAAMSNSNTTVELLGESFKYAAQMGGTLNYSIEDVTLALGLMASSGVKGSQAGTGLRMALKNLADTSKLAAAETNGFKISMDDGYGKALPLRDVLGQLRDQFGGLNLELLDSEGNLKSGEQLWAEYGDSLPATQMEKFRTITELVGVRALPGIMGVINSSQEDFDKLANAIDTADQGFVRINGEILKTSDAINIFGKEAVDANGELLGTAEAMREIQLSTAEGQITLLKDNFAALAVELGKEVIPYIIDFVNYLSDLIDKFRALDPDTKKTILTIAGIAAAIGPVLIAIGQLAIGIGGIIELGGMLVAAFSNPIVLAIAAAAAVVAAIAWLADNWEEFCAAARELWDSLVEFFTALWEGFKWMISDVWNSIKESVITIVTTIKDKLIEIWESIKEKVSDTINSLKEFLSTTWNNIKTSVTNSVTAVKTTMVNIWTSIKNTVSSIVEGIKNTVSNVWNNIKTTASNVWNGIKTTATNVWNGIKSAILSPIESAREKLHAIIEKIKGFFPISLTKIFSNFKMPHLSWTWKDVGGILKIPSFHVDWYAKAMKNGIPLDGATIFGMNSKGQPMGGGEVGREWIIGENGLQAMIRNEVSRNQLSPDVIYNAVVQGMENANVTVIMDGQKVTNVISKRIGAGQAANLRYYGV